MSEPQQPTWQGTPAAALSSPLVSCVMATVPARRHFLGQAVKYFLRQSYEAKELIVVDDWTESPAATMPADARVRYLRVEGRLRLGRKLNIGIETARGSIIQKLDDDDYYHPEFLTAMASAFGSHDPDRALCAIDCFPVLLSQTGELKWTGHGSFAGGTFCFSRRLWRRCPFRDVPTAVDRQFLRDHNPEKVHVCQPGLYIYLRHGGPHLWTHYRSQDVVDFYRGRPDFWKPLEELVDLDDFRFYQSLRGEGPA